ARAASRKRPTCSGANRLGVPPPKNIETSERPCAAAASIARSSISASMYCCCGIDSGAACELKSQYGHLRTHHGMCTYKASGGRLRTDRFHLQLRDQSAQRLAAM